MLEETKMTSDTDRMLEETEMTSDTDRMLEPSEDQENHPLWEQLQTSTCKKNGKFIIRQVRWLKADVLLQTSSSTYVFW